MQVLEREAELDRLEAALRAAADGSGRAVFVGGEAGIGKTTLVETFADRAHRTSTVAFGRCDALGTPRALGAFADIAGALGVAGPADRDALFGALLGAVRSRAPAMLVVEDAHWADDGTIDLIALLGRRAVDLPLLLVVTYRDEEVGAGHPLRVALGNLATASGATWLGLAPLSIDAVRVLAGCRDVSPEDVHELTGGNPFYVTETLAAPDRAVSTNVRLAVLARASRLGHAAREVLDAVSVVPGRTERWLLEALCAPAPDDLDECLAAGVLVAGDGDIVFRHELARRAIEHELSTARRRAFHRRAVDALVERRADPARVAHHADGAGAEAELAHASAEACRLALARNAIREAVEHGRRALAAAHHFDGDQLAALQLSLGQALYVGARTDEAIALARDAADHWSETGDARSEAAALNHLSQMYVGDGRTAESTDAAERAVRILERRDPGPELAAAYQRLCSTHMLARNRDAAVVWGERAVALSATLDDPLLLGRALVEYGIADVMDSRFEGLERIHRAIDLGRKSNVPTVVVGGLSQIGSGCGELRRYDHAVPALVEGAAFAAEHNLESPRRYIVAWLARCRFDLGQWDEAERLAFDVVGGSRGNVIARFVALNTLGWLRARRGDVDVWPLLDEALEIARRTHHLQRLWPCAVARAEAGWLAGDPGPHLDLVEESRRLAVACRHHVATGELGVALRRAGRPPAGDAPSAEPFASWLRGDTNGAAAGFQAMGCPYESAAALADSDDARSLREAMATFDRLGARPAADRLASRLESRGVRVARTPRPASGDAHPQGLSDREVEVLRLVAAGFTNPQIAAALYISRKTAEHHVSNILGKLGVGTRAEAASASVRLGITLP